MGPHEGKSAARHDSYKVVLAHVAGILEARQRQDDEQIAVVPQKVWESFDHQATLVRRGHKIQDQRARYQAELGSFAGQRPFHEVLLCDSSSVVRVTEVDAHDRVE